MTSKLTHELDEALARQMDLEPLSAILASYPQEEADALRPFLETSATLELLQQVELPDDDALAADRANFMACVNNLPPIPVSVGPLVRLKGWMAQRLPSQPTILPKKELKPMSALIIKVMLIFSLMFGAAGGTAAMTFVSQPNSPLYPLKMTMEQARLALAGQTAQQASLHLAFAQERAEEIAYMARAGTPADDALVTRLRNQWQLALQLMAQSPEEAMMGLLVQAQVMVQQQLQLLQATGGDAASGHMLAQVSAMVAYGLEDPQAFRQMGGDLKGDFPAGPYGPGDGSCQDPNGCDSDGPHGPTGPVPDEIPGAGPGGPNGPVEGNCEESGTCEGDGPHGRQEQGAGGFRPGPNGEGQGGFQPGPNGPNGDGQCENPGECEGEGPYGPQGPEPAEPSETGHEDAPRTGPGPGGPQGFGEGQPGKPGDGSGESPGPGGPQGPGDGERYSPSADDNEPNDPGDGEPNGPGEAKGEPNGPSSGNEDNQKGDDNGQIGGENGQTGSENGQTDGDSGQTDGDSGQTGGDSGQTGGGDGRTGGDSGQTGGGGGQTGGGGNS